MKRRLCVSVLILWNVLMHLSSAQVLAQPPDTVYKKIVPYVFVREADAMWAKRVWRTIDLREKINFPYYYPSQPSEGRMSLFDILKKGIRSGRITAYGNPFLDDQFTEPLTTAQAEKMFIRLDTITTIDENEMEKRIPISEEVSSPDIKQYWIKEDWFFDRQRSVMDVRIIGICPLKENKGDDGEVRGYQPMFWVYFPEIRQSLANSHVYVYSNNSSPVSYDDLFMKRYFGSYIHKESNVFDRSITEYATGLNTLLEAERVKEEIANYEHDLWHY